MSIKKFVYKQGAAIQAYSLEAQGVCWELCRRWVAGHLAGTWEVNETIWDIDTGASAFTEVLEIHQARRRYTEENKGIEGYAKATSAVRSTGCCSFKGLRSRTDVINHVLTVPGVFIFIMTAPNGGGHAMSFDTRADPAYFFDPNQGEWQFIGESDANMRNWWSGFWDATGDGDLDYKNAFHRGERELVRYNTIG
jgi:Yersinia/Haemophilus virulence surface antigen